jgi:hypothetical protein
MFKTWEEMSRKEQLAATHYDFYKEVHGIRPRWIDYDAMTEQELEAEMEFLGKQAEVVFAEEAAREKEMIAQFERDVAATIAIGAGDRETALRWIMEGSDCRGDWEFLCYERGLPYGYFKKVVDAQVV